MRHIRLLAAVVGLVACAAFGCGSKPTTEPTSDTSGGTRPNATSNKNSPKGLFADMPAEAYPKYGPEGGIERAKARKWMKENLIGRTVEWNATINTVSITGNDPFKVWLVTPNERLFPKGLTNGFDGGVILLGSRECQVVIVTAGWSEISRNTCSVPYDNCTTAEAEKFRQLKGQRVTFGGRITSTDVGDRATTVEDLDGKVKRTVSLVSLILEVAPPSVDGFLPEASKPKKPN